jgi:hypothetical protein
MSSKMGNRHTTPRRRIVRKIQINSHESLEKYATGVHVAVRFSVLVSACA